MSLKPVVMDHGAILRAMAPWMPGACLLAFLACGGGGNAPDPAPQITDFRATPDTLYGPGRTDLVATFSGGKATISPFDYTFTESTTLKVYLEKSWDFALTVTSSSGDYVFKTAHVTVLPSVASQMHGFTCTPVLNWNGTNFEAIADFGLGTGTLNGTALTSGIPLQVQATEPTIMTLKVDGGTCSQRIEALVSPIQPGINYMAGSIGGEGSLDGAARMARFAEPRYLAKDRRGRIFITERGPYIDFSNHRSSIIRLLDTDGRVKTYCGSTTEPGALDGPLTDARVDRPGAMTVDDQDNLWFFDAKGLRVVEGNDHLRTIGVPDGMIPEAANVEAACWDPASRSVLFCGLFPEGGQIYRYAPSTKTFTLFTTDKSICWPSSILPLPSGNFLVTDSNGSSVTEFDPSGTVLPGAYKGGCGENAVFCGPRGLTRNEVGEIFVITEDSNMVWQLFKLPQGWVVDALSGHPNEGAFADGDWATSMLNRPHDMVCAGAKLIVADSGNHVLRAVDSHFNFSTMAGLATPNLIFDPANIGVWGPVSYTTLLWGEMAVDAKGQVLVGGEYGLYKAGLDGSMIGVVTRLRGDQTASVDGPPGVCTVGWIYSLVPGPEGSIFFYENSFIGGPALRRMDANGEIKTLFSYRGGNQNGPSGTAGIEPPSQMAYAPDGDLYFTNYCARTIRRIHPDGSVDTFAGGTLTSPYFEGIAIGQDGTIFASSNSEGIIRVYHPGGTESVLAGTPGEVGDADGKGAEARFRNLGKLQLDAEGNLWAVDWNRFRKITPDGTVTTPIGSLISEGTQPGPLPGTLRAPTDIGFLPSGDAVVLSSRMCYLVYVKWAAPLQALAQAFGLPKPDFLNNPGSGHPRSTPRVSPGHTSFAAATAARVIGK